MSRPRWLRPGALVALALLNAAALSVAWPVAVAARGVGDASWTPSTSTTRARAGSFIVAGDAILYVTHAVWDKAQVEGLAAYSSDALRYTHEINDRSGRLSATGYWATNLPDPAYDRDDDDGDRRWEEAEITAGEELPTPGVRYTTLIELSRWHGKREGGRCRWAWDRRQGSADVLSQLSRDLLGEWQALRYTLAYDELPYPRVEGKPAVPGDAPRAQCREPRPGPTQAGVVVTFDGPLRWSDFLALPDRSKGRWTAFEAIGSARRDSLVWTCGGPVVPDRRLRPCRALGVRPDGVSAAAGYFDGDAVRALRDHPSVARVDELQDAVTSLLFDVGGFGVERPDLTINDAYWELFLADRAR